MGPVKAIGGKASLSAKDPPAAVSSASSASSASTGPNQESKMASNRFRMAWSTPSKLHAEKAALKRRLKRYDNEFRRKHGRKPTHEDKEPIRHLYEAYNAIKILLSGGDATLHLGKGSSENKTVLVQRLLQEKRALQGKLKLFERDFEAQHNRKVQYARDIKGMESEYRRYKELRQFVNKHL